MKIGAIGLGKMGIGIAANLLKTGHQVTVWNRSPEPVALLAAQGAIAAEQIEDALQGDILISMLASDAVMRELGFDGALLDKAAKNLIHINMATISIAFARELAAAHDRRALGYVAAPVFGRPDAAAAGQMLIVAAGPRATLARLDPLFAAMGRRTEIVGERPEQANLFKIAGNFMIANAIGTMAETFALLGKGGVDARVFHDILTSSLFAAPIYQNYGKLMLDGNIEPGFSLKLGLKDVRLATEAGQNLGMALPLGNVLIDHLEQAMALGLGEKDWTAIAGVLACEAKTQKAGI